MAVAIGSTYRHVGTTLTGMTRELIYAHVSAVLSTLFEVGEPAPESSLYLAMESNIERYHMI